MYPFLASSLLMDNHGECSVSKKYSITVLLATTVYTSRQPVVSVHFYLFVDFVSNILSFQKVLCTAQLAIATIGSAPIEGVENVVLRLETLISLHVDSITRQAK